jgi:esterase
VPERTTVRRGAVALAVWRWPGAGLPALLLHGIGNYGRYWDLFAAAMAGRMSLIAPDARGHGDSDAPAFGYDAAEFVADALAVLDAEAVDRAAMVVGHSMGGAHAIALAAGHPHRLGALALVDVGPEPLPEGSERARRLSLGRPDSFASEGEALAYLRATSPGYTEEVYRNRLEWAFRREDGRLVWRSSRDALSEIFRGRSDPKELWAQLRAIRCPTLVVRGTRSNVLSAEVARRMAATMPSARLVELEAGHNVALERPTELATALRDFIGPGVRIHR